MEPDFQTIITEVYHETNVNTNQGNVASYIPELSKVCPDKFGICLVDIQGNEYKIGDADERFSIQSISKVFALAMVFGIEKEKLWERIGVEPSGGSFNSLMHLESEQGKPRNPLINSGALVITDLMVSHKLSPLKDLIHFIEQLSNVNGINFNPKVAHSELQNSSRNTALAYFMKSYSNIHNSVSEIISIYCHQCAIEMSCTELARAFLFFANEGVNFYTNERILTSSQTKRLNAIMQTCGFYDEAGEFAFKVGLPGKSGVGGGVSAVMPGKFSVTVWSPGLNAKGNSLKGVKALELLTTKLGTSIF